MRAVFSPGSEKASHFMMKVPEGVAAEGFRGDTRACRRATAAHRPQGAGWPCELTPVPRRFRSAFIYHFTRTR